MPQRGTGSTEESPEYNGLWAGNVQPKTGRRAKPHRQPREAPRLWRLHAGRTRTHQRSTTTPRTPHIRVSDQSGLPTYVIEQSHIPTYVIELSHLPTNVIDQSQLPTNVIDQSHLPSDVIEQSHLPSDVTEHFHLPL